MPRVDHILEKLHRRPALYTGENTLTSIRHFLSGYGFSLMLHEIPSADDPLVIPREFHDWVAYRLHYYESTSGWCNMICDRTDTDQQAIDRFFELLSEFKHREPHTVAKLTDFSKTYQQSTVRRDDNCDVSQTPPMTRSYPKSISLVTYTDDPGFFAYSDTHEPFPSEGFHPDLQSFELRTGADKSLLTILDNKWNPRPHRGA